MIHDGFGMGRSASGHIHSCCGYPRRERDRCRESAAEQQVEMLCLKYRR